MNFHGFLLTNEGKGGGRRSYLTRIQSGKESVSDSLRESGPVRVRFEGYQGKEFELGTLLLHFPFGPNIVQPSIGV